MIFDFGGHRATGHQACFAVREYDEHTLAELKFMSAARGSVD
jgi:hypothetical protein